MKLREALETTGVAMYGYTKITYDSFHHTESRLPWMYIPNVNYGNKKLLKDWELDYIPFSDFDVWEAKPQYA